MLGVGAGIYGFWAIQRHYHLLPRLWSLTRDAFKAGSDLVMGVSSVSGGQHRGGGVGAAPGYSSSDKPLLHSTESLLLLLFDRFSPRGVFLGVSNMPGTPGQERNSHGWTALAGQLGARASTLLGLRDDRVELAADLSSCYWL